MKVLHLTTSDTGAGGSLAAMRLHAAFQKMGHESQVLTLEKHTFTRGVVALHEAQSLLSRQGTKLLHKGSRWKNRKWQQSNPDYYFWNQRDLNLVTTKKLVSLLNPGIDLIIAHWITGFMDAKRLYEISQLTGAPIYWIMMDMGPFTGGCHYAWDCRNFEKSCGSCPALDSRDPGDLSHKQWALKKKYHDLTDLSLISCSTPTLEHLERSSLFAKKRRRQIFLASNTEVFRAIPQEVARMVLGLPLDKKIIFFGAQMIHEKRKGITLLQAALDQLSARLKGEKLSTEIFLAIAGNDSAVAELKLPFPHKNLGFLADERILAAAYQAADTFVCPSIQDLGPLMVNESIACGTPVVSFDVGVSRDLVLNGKTGYRAKTGDATDLALGLESVLSLSSGDAAKMREACLALAHEHLRPEVQVNGILKFHEERNA